MLQLFRALSAVLALVAIALVSALITMRFAIHGAEVRVPALSGLTMPAAVARLHSLGLKAGVDGHFYSPTQPAGAVLTQSPTPGTRVRKSWRVRVTESLGPQRVAIPSVEGMDAGIATITIRRTGLQVGNSVGIPYAYAPENTVIAQTPLAGATDVQAPKVGILTAQAVPPAEDSSVMPDLTGENFTTAALSIMRAGFKLAPLQEAAKSPPAAALANPMAGAAPAPSQASVAPAPTSVATPAKFVPSGTVIAQLPAAGDRIVAGATVQLTVQP
ncbi:MAG: PASTA domain-containing protein [Acidobacteriaceae bacterium]